MGRVQVLECENATLRAASSEEEEEEEEEEEALVEGAAVEGVDGADGAVEAAAASRRLDRRSLLRLGGAATAFGAGAIVMRPSAAGATTANMQYGVDNNAGTDTTGLTSSNATDTLHVTNSSTGHSTSGRAIDAHITDPASEAAAIVATQDGTSHAIVGTITSTNGGAGVVGIGVDGGGVVGVTQGVAPAVAGITAGNAGPAVLAWGYNAATIGDACEAVNMGTGHAIYAHIENAANGRSTIYGTTNGTNSAVNAAILNARSKASTITASMDESWTDEPGFISMRAAAWPPSGPWRVRSSEYPPVIGWRWVPGSFSDRSGTVDSVRLIAGRALSGSSRESCRPETESSRTPEASPAAPATRPRMATASWTRRRDWPPMGSQRTAVGTSAQSCTEPPGLL